MSPDQPIRERSNIVRCNATKRSGDRCKAYAASDGFCSIHGGRVDPRELGRRGGTKRADRAAGVDETLAASEAGRRKLLELTEHDDPRVAIAASKALYSISPTRPPAADKPDSADGHAVQHDPARVLAMLEEVGLVAPALVATVAAPTPGEVGEVLDTSGSRLTTGGVTACRR